MASRLCDKCGRQSADAKVCGQCKVKHYCSKDCQVADWKAGHKKECAAFKSGAKKPEKKPEGETTRFPLPSNMMQKDGTRAAQQHALAMAMLHGAPPGASRWAGEKLPYNSEQGRVIHLVVTAKEQQDWAGCVAMEEEGLRVAHKLKGHFPKGFTAIVGALGVSHEGVGNFKRAKELHEMMLEFCRGIGDKGGEGMASGNVGNCLAKQSWYQEAMKYYQREIDLSREVGSKMQEGRANGNMGLCFERMGQHAEADERFERHLELAIECGDRIGIACAYSNLGNSAYREQNYEKAVELHTKHLNISRECGDRANEARAITNLGKCRDAMGDYEEGLKLLQKRLAIARQTKDKHGELLAQANLFFFYLQSGMFREAVETGQARLALGREVGDIWAVGTSLASLAKIHYSSGHTEKALDLLQQVRRRFLCSLPVRVRAPRRRRCLLQD